jgi:MarR family transcriptional regulator, organic hydroperoxide resistance regulator
MHSSYDPSVRPALETDPAVRAWRAMFELTLSKGRPRFPAVAQDLGLTPQQLQVLRLLADGSEVPMGALADKLFCEASNVTGIVDRLETRGLIERRPDAADRRVKRLAITGEGLRVHSHALERLYEPPPEIARLSRAEQRTLADLLVKALDQRE